MEKMKSRKETLETKRKKIINRNRKLREQIITRTKKCDQWRTEISENVTRLNALNEELKQYT